MLATLFVSVSATAASSSSSSKPNPPSRVVAPTKVPGLSLLPEQNSRRNAAAAVKMPTAPWMKGPLLLHPHEVLDLAKPHRSKGSGSEKVEKLERAFTEKVVGGRGKKAVKRIVQSIEKLQLRNHSGDEIGPEMERPSSGLSFENVTEGAKSDFDEELKLPWVKHDIVVFRRMKKEKVVTKAEQLLDKELLARLRGEAKKLRKWVKVMKIGVSEAVVDEINFIWRRNELAVVKFDIPLCRNMDRAQEILEMKTGGLVVWRTKDTLVIYRGTDYHLKRFSRTDPALSAAQQSSAASDTMHLNLDKGSVQDENVKIEADKEEDGILMGDEDAMEVNGSLYERETDRLLDGLGPRFEDWWMRKPLPVDADLLPEVVPGFKPPFRLCPPKNVSQLSDEELTYLRKLAKPLPTHFVLGRNRKLQGLAAAIIKLWEKSLIAKIAVKWGALNTSNEEMANELKSLTGGVLLLRNKFYILLYRGNDFLPCGVASSIAERELELNRCQLFEEHARLKASESVPMVDEPSPCCSSTTGTLSEFLEMQGTSKKEQVGAVQLEAEIERLKKKLRKQQRKLFILESKMNISEKQLFKLNSRWGPTESDPDQEIMTEEERACFRKIGLKMDGQLVLGRRGVFGGVMEALHQHWKHREVAKVITMQRTYMQVIDTAEVLEAESGGIIVSVDKQKVGHSIILYRGKNYRRPLKLSNEHLLTKRKALQRSIEMQRFGSLKYFANQRQQAISDLKLKLAEVQNQLADRHDVYGDGFHKARDASFLELL